MFENKVYSLREKAMIATGTVGLLATDVVAEVDNIIHDKFEVTQLVSFGLPVAFYYFSKTLLGHRVTVQPVQETEDQQINK
jgi:hypothetical protein